MEERLCSIMDSKLSPLGFESHPFLLRWYNETVSPPFRFDRLDSDTLAFVVLSVPRMFENSFVPFLCGETACEEEGRDPVDSFMKIKFQEMALDVQNTFDEVKNVEVIHDFEMIPGSRRPKILVQTAAHVAGAAYYYQQSDVKDKSWQPTQKMFGVCIHPKYGGWFAIRGIFIFPEIHFPNLTRKESLDVLETDAKKIEVLERFNGNWRDCTYRDVIPVEQRYSDQQKLYFLTPPTERKLLVEQMKLTMNKAKNVNAT